ncbi:MAG: 50S ribosomal protein L11 methyltransferase [Myxococcaceae bacterium]|nr:50S ribosomal protein L11 methyltransferase [Myxococcaceae bacterium]
MAKRTESWTAVTLDVPLRDLDDAQGLLTACGCAGLELRDGEGGLPGIRQPKSGRALVIGSFETKAKAQAALKTARARLKAVAASLEPIEVRDWSTEWRARIRPVRVGRLWVGPPWETPPAGAVALRIEPKMAFGTGDHATTRLCLQAVDDFLAAHPKATVLDVGTGTGVLALAARALGAGRTVGTDNDPVAVELAIECAQENGIEGVEFREATLDGVSGEFDLVLANILANTLVQLAPHLAPKVGRRLVLAGVLVHQRAEVETAFLAQGLRAAGHAIEGEWIRLDFERAR